LCFQALSEEKGNVVCSALSVHLALAMLHAGAKGETAEELSKALCLATDLESSNQGFKELVTNLHVCKGYFFYCRFFTASFSLFSSDIESSGG
jgi:serine protease inhibitor